MSNVRNSNHEIMRILSMFYIVLWHVILYSGVLYTKNESIKIICNMLLFLIAVHVNSFVLVTGYYQSKSTFKQSKVWQIIGSSWFYRVTIMITFILAKIDVISKLQIIKDLLPVTTDNYWFIKMYLLLYCLSPFINKLISCLDKKTYQKLLLVGVIIFCIVPNITNGEFLFNNGYTLYNFVYLYLIGAYLREYPIEKSYFFKIFSSNLFKLIMIIIFVSCAILNNIVYSYGCQLNGINTILSTISNTMTNTALNYSNPIIIIQSIAYFSFFTTLTLKSKIINKISGLMLGVYYIHENDHIRSKLYDWTGMLNSSKESFLIIIKMLLIAGLIFIISTIIELIRQKISIAISKTKFVKAAKKKYYDWSKSLHVVEV